ncbi:thiamine pyrophosphate-dependent enzyme [Terriglobus tenax]|uniref:hypothetical protein n=1 Tax=Terriglobus tenax TaxID=1111115 RepID=UPI0021E07F5B|nr:hypothetical protein [Terriglobus tenax]
MSAATFENPLIPNQRLKQLYNAMRDLRTGSKKTRGLEAGIAATASHLRPQDTIAASATLGLAVAIVQQSSGNLLPPALDADQKFAAAHGAAFANKHFTPGSVAVLYLDSALPASYGRFLEMTALRELPVVYVQAPGHKAHPAAVKHKIPVIPVDVNDVVACYRVAQEAFTRARTLHLPTWISFQQVDKEDPLDRMRSYLKSKGLLARG